MLVPELGAHFGLGVLSNPRRDFIQPSVGFVSDTFRCISFEEYPAGYTK
jgi:hypothetical protein